MISLNPISWAWDLSRRHKSTNLFVLLGLKCWRLKNVPCWAILWPIRPLGFWAFSRFLCFKINHGDRLQLLLVLCHIIRLVWISIRSYVVNVSHEDANFLIDATKTWERGNDSSIQHTKRLIPWGFVSDSSKMIWTSLIPDLFSPNPCLINYKNSLPSCILHWLSQFACVVFILETCTILLVLKISEGINYEYMLIYHTIWDN